MERRLFIETFGLLTKLEHVMSLNHQRHPNALILEITQPYPGYYSAHDLDTDKPRTIFFVTKERCAIDHIIRLGYEARRVLKHDIDVTPAKISIYADSYNAIRVKYLKDFNMLKELQEFLKGEGVCFLRYKRIDEVAAIEIHKLFCIEEIVEGIYQDLDEPGERYITLSTKLDFGQFLKVSNAVKNNIDYTGFDAALAVFCRKKGIVDAVRIFDPNIHLENLQKIQTVFEEQIKRLKLQEI